MISVLLPLLPVARLAAPAYAPCSQLSELPSPPLPETTEKLFPGFVADTVKTAGASINVLKGGEGPPLLLIHGHPETHVTWHKIAADLARNYSVIIPDLRGYGDSSKPDGGKRQVNYSFRAMAQDQVETMRHFGYERDYDNWFPTGLTDLTSSQSLRNRRISFQSRLSFNCPITIP